MRDIEKLRKDAFTVMEWRKLNKNLTKEEQRFAEAVADEMIALVCSKKVGVQLVSKSNMEFIRKQEPMGSDAVAGITQDVVATGPAKKKKDERVAKADGKYPRNTPDIPNIKLEIPKNQRDGVVSAVMDGKVEPKPLGDEPKEKIEVADLGHDPSKPMPKLMAEDIVENAKWGVEIGAYTNIKEGIERQLGRKAYAEFVSTPEQVKGVYSFITSLVDKVEPIKVA